MNISQWIKHALTPTRWIIGRILYPAPGLRDYSQKDFYYDSDYRLDSDNHIINQGKDINLYIPGSGETESSQYYEYVMIPAPAFYGGIFSLQSYSDHVYQKIVCAINTNPSRISVTGYSMGGAALTLALDKANTEGVFKEKNIEVRAKIINTFGSLKDVVSEQESLIPVLTLVLYIISIPFLILACINPTQIPNIFLILFSTPLLLTAYLITSILESITASVEHIFAPLKPSKALGKISNQILSIMADFLLSLDPNNPNVLEAATRLISEPSIPNLSFKIYQASDDQVIPEGARLGNNKELKGVTTISPGGHNSMPSDATSMLSMLYGPT